MENFFMFQLLHLKPHVQLIDVQRKRRLANPADNARAMQAVAQDSYRLYNHLHKVASMSMISETGSR
jgi:hypothetical protein